MVTAARIKNIRVAKSRSDMLQRGVTEGAQEMKQTLSFITLESLADYALLLGNCNNIFCLTQIKFLARCSL